jgi:hypothetical protein
MEVLTGNRSLDYSQKSRFLTTPNTTAMPNLIQVMKCVVSMKLLLTIAYTLP